MLASGERVRLVTRPHGIVLARPLAHALALAAGGAALVWLGWPFSVPAAALFALGAGVALRAVWRWERTRFVVTSEKLLVVHGTVRRRAAGVPLAKIQAVETEQSLAGRLLGYGTVVAGDLELTHVPDPRAVSELIAA